VGREGCSVSRGSARAVVISRCIVYAFAAKNAAPLAVSAVQPTRARGVAREFCAARLADGAGESPAQGVAPIGRRWRLLQPTVG
jgi:hypothetical protein